MRNRELEYCKYERYNKNNSNKGVVSTTLAASEKDETETLKPDYKNIEKTDRKHCLFD